MGCAKICGYLTRVPRRVSRDTLNGSEILLQETVEFNKEAFHLFRKERDEVIDELIHDVVPPDMERQFLDLIDRIDDGNSIHKGSNTVLFSTK